MELQNLYNKIKNESKLNDDTFLLECLEFYKTSSRAISAARNDGTRSSDFYNKLVKDEKNKDTTSIDIQSEARFYIMMTNIWIQNIMLLTDEDIEYLKQKGTPKYKEIKEIISGVKNVNTMEEVITLYNSINKILTSDHEMDEKKYFWIFDQEKSGTLFSGEGQTGFYHVISRYVDARKSNNIDHNDYRLYINCQSSDVFELMSLYVQLCRKRQIPYYFKFGIDKNRKDKFIVYCKKDLLLENIDILKEISKIKPEISKNSGEMLSLLGNIDDWIGISSNPKKVEGKANFSFNSMRAEILEDAAELTVLNFIEQNKGKLIQYNGQSIDFNINLAKHAANIVINNLIDTQKITKSDPNIKNYYYEIMKQLLKNENGNSPLDIALKKNKRCYATKESHDTI